MRDSAHASPSTVARPLPAWAAALGQSAVQLAAHVPAPLRQLIRRLPLQPPSFAMARVLDRVLLPRLDAQQRRQLSGRTVEVELLDLGVRVRLQLGSRGFFVAPAADAPALTIRATSAAIWRLVRGEDDADRLFFQHALLMEGDTEFGLVLKNTLDAIGPL